MKNQVSTFFEPWSLGDAVIAANAARRLKKADGERRIIVATASRYVPLLSRLFPGLDFDPIDLAYTSRAKTSFTDGLSLTSPSAIRATEVLGIRGDIRDYRAAALRYPKSYRRMSGWAAFAIRRLPIFDSLFRSGILTTKNRYDRWADLLKISRLARDLRLPRAPFQNARISIHIGAQWGARRYPYVANLANLLRARGHTVNVVGGPGDPSLADGEVTRVLEGPETIEFFRTQTDLLVANDSAPLHIGAALDLPVVGLFGNNSADEWSPPGTLVVTRTIRGGYRPKFPYTVDDPHSGGRPWPSPDEIIQAMADAKMIEP